MVTNAGEVGTKFRREGEVGEPRGRGEGQGVSTGPAASRVLEAGPRRQQRFVRFVQLPAAAEEAACGVPLPRARLHQRPLHQQRSRPDSTGP